MKSLLFAPLTCLIFASQLDAVVIVAEEATFTPPQSQAIFPAGNLNVFKQFVLGFEVEEQVGEKVEIDLLFTTLEFGGEVEVGIGAFFGLEFGLCLGGSADYDLRFAPRVTLPDIYPTEVPVPITVAEGLLSSSHFKTNFPSLGTMYADLILDLSAKLRAEACVFGCFTPIDINLSSCDLPLFNLSSRCDPFLTERAYCAIELASLNRDGNNTARMINVGADNIAEFLAEPHLEYDLLPDLPIGGSYGTVSLAAPTIETNSLDSPFNTSQVLKSSGAEDVVGVGIDLAALVKDVLLPPPFPPLNDDGSIGPIDWNYVIASLEVGPAVQLQMDFEVDWDLVVTDMTFTDSATGQPKDVLLFTAIGVDFPINGARVTKLSNVPGFTVGNYQLLNCGPRAMPMVSLVTDSWNGNGTRPPQGGVNVDITYSLVPRLMTVVSLPLVGKVDYEVLSAGAEISRVGDLQIGPLVEGAHKFKLGEFEVYRGSPSTMASTGSGNINFTMQAAGPPSYNWNPASYSGTPSNTYQWTTRSSTQRSYWQELVGMTQASFPGQGGPSSNTMIKTTPYAKLNADIEIASLKVSNGNGLEIQSATATPELKISGLIENSGYVSVDGNASLWMNSQDVVLCGNGALRLSNGGTLRGDPNAFPFSFCNYNTITGAGGAMDDYLKFRNRTRIHNLGQITADGTAGNNGSSSVNLSLTLDDYPGETTWQITTLSGSTVASGGPYTGPGTTVNQNIPLAEGSYLFTITDDADDGICCSYGNGSYTLTSSSGTTLATGGEFQTAETKTFSIITGSHLKTGADSFVNEGVLGANANGRLILDSDYLENLIGSYTRANGGQIDLRARVVEHIGSLEATNSGKVLIKPLFAISSADWRAGQSFREDCGGFSANQNGIIELENTLMTGGCFFLNSSGNLTTSLSSFNGSVFEIGNPGDSTPDMDINGTEQIFTRSCLNNFGTLRVSGKAEFRDSMLFANHGTLKIPAGGELRIKENFATTPGASEEALREPGIANATRTTLLGGKWDIAGKLYIEGANFTTIGADVAPASTTSGSINTEQLNGVDPIAVTVPQEGPSHILSGGAPAEVTLRGGPYQFLALNTLATNCGTLNLIEGADFRPHGDFTNNREINIGSGSVFEPNGIFIQTRPDASVTLADGGLLRPQGQQYDISGGTITAARIDSIFHTFNKIIKTGADIRIASPIIDTNEAVYRLEKVVIDIPTLIETINPGAKVNIHGCGVEFPALSDNLKNNLGHFVLSGEGTQNPGKFEAQNDFNDEFMNRGQLDLIGYTTEFKTENFTQLGNAAETRIGAGARLNVDGILNIDGGKIVFEIGSRPYLDNYATISGSPYQAHFANSLVIDFVGELAESIKTVDIGDTWTLLANQPVTVTGIGSVEYLVNGLTPVPGWLPVNSHLELSQFETPFGPRGLRVRVKPDAGFRTYDIWAASEGIDPASYHADPALQTASPGIQNITRFIYGSDDRANAALQFVTIPTDGSPQRYAKFSFQRPAGTDVTYSPYYSLDLKYWRRAPMTLLPVGPPVSPGMLETVTFQTTYPIPDKKFYYRIQPEINLENFDLGEVPQDPLNLPGGLNNFNQTLVSNGKIVSYLVEPGKSLYFNVNLPQNVSGSNIWGGTDAEGNRNFIYRDRTELELAVRHAGLITGGGRALVKVTFIDAQQTPFIGSTQNSGTNDQITSKNNPVEAVPYSYRVELIKRY